MKMLLLVILVFGQTSGELFDLLLHIPDFFEDIGHGVARFFDFQWFFVVWEIGAGDAAGAGDRNLRFGEVYFEKGVD